MSYLLVRLVHLLCMAFWLSSIVKDLCDPFIFEGNEENDRKLHVARGKRAEVLGTVSGMGTILSGGILLYFFGFSNIPWPVYVGLALTIVMACIGALGVGGVFQKMSKVMEVGSDLSELDALVREFKNWSLLSLVLWFIVFLLMGLRHVL